MWFYQVLTVLLISSIPFFEKQFVYYDNPPLVVTTIQFFSIILLPIFIKLLFLDIKSRFAPTFFFIALLIPLAISTIYSINVTHSGIILSLFASYFVIFVSTKTIFSTFRSKEILVLTFILISSILSAISLYNTLILQEINKDHVNFFGIFYGHNHLSALLVFSIPLSLYFLKSYWNNKRIRILSIIICTLLIISLLFTLSIGAMLSLGISFVLGSFLFGKNLIPKKVFYGMFIFLTFFALLTLLYFSQSKGIDSLDFKKNPLIHASHRLIFWQRAYDNFLEKPLTGHGLDTYGLVKVNDQTPPHSSNAHNFFVQTLSDAGIFGFFAVIMLVASIFKKGYDITKKNLSKKKSLFFISLFIAILSSVLFAAIDFDWYLPTVSIYFWVFAGFLTSYVK
ncbi:MAG: hypothetical protein ACD_50C00051G0005 [uncultured bacterium]|nr:MAG: hypothetical protein ACD_50C00051G0005 [uncultured bacterium]